MSVKSAHSVSHHYSQMETGHIKKSIQVRTHNQIYLWELYNHISIAFLVVNSKLASEAFWKLSVYISPYHARNNREPEDYTHRAFFFTSLLCLNTSVCIWVWSSWKNVNKSTLASNCQLISCRNKGKATWQNRTEICASVDGLLEKVITSSSSCSCVSRVCSCLLLLVLFPHLQLLFGLEECSFFSALINMLYPVIAGITITLVFTLCNGGLWKQCGLPSGLTFLSFYWPFQRTWTLLRW